MFYFLMYNISHLSALIQCCCTSFFWFSNIIFCEIYFLAMNRPATKHLLNNDAVLLFVVYCVHILLLFMFVVLLK